MKNLLRNDIQNILSFWKNNLFNLESLSLLLNFELFYKDQNNPIFLLLKRELSLSDSVVFKPAGLSNLVDDVLLIKSKFYDELLSETLVTTIFFKLEEKLELIIRVNNVRINEFLDNSFPISSKTYLNCIDFNNSSELIISSTEINSPNQEALKHLFGEALTSFSINQGVSFISKFNMPREGLLLRIINYLSSPVENTFSINKVITREDYIGFISQIPLPVQEFDLLNRKVKLSIKNSQLTFWYNCMLSSLKHYSSFILEGDAEFRNQKKPGQNLELPLSLSFPLDLNAQWFFSLRPNSSIPLDNLVDFIALFVSDGEFDNIVCSLPTFVRNFLENIQLTNFNLGLFHDFSYKSLFFEVAIKSLERSEELSNKHPNKRTIEIIPNILELEEVKLVLSHEKKYARSTLSGTVDGKFEVAKNTLVHAFIRFPIGEADWYIETCEAVKLFDFSDLDQYLQIPRQTLGGLLPKSLAGKENGKEKKKAALTLSRFKLSYNPASNCITGLSISLHSKKMWTIIPGCLEIGRPKLSLDLQRSNEENWELMGSVQGRLAIGNAQIDVSVNKYNPKGDWHLVVLTERVVLPTLEDLTQLIGSTESFREVIPASVLSAELSLSDIGLSVNINQKEIEKFKFNLSVDKLDFGIIALSEASVGVNLEWVEGKRSEEYEAQGTLRIGDLNIWMRAHYSTETKWDLQGSAFLSEPLSLEKLVDDVAKVVNCDFIKLPLPEFMLKNLDVSFSTKTEDFYFSGSTELILDDNKLKMTATVSVTHPNIYEIDKPKKSQVVLSLILGIGFGINYAEIKFTADNKKENPGWKYSGELIKGPLALTELIKKLSLALNIPYFNWLPDLRITVAQGEIIPDINYLFFKGDMEISELSIPFLGSELSMTKLGCEIKKLNDPKKPADNCKKGFIYGNFNFASLNAILKMHLQETEKASKTHFTALLTDEKLDSNKLALISDSLVAKNESNQSTWSSLVPQSFKGISFEEAYLYLEKEKQADNKTIEKFLVYGKVAGLGQAIFLAQQLSDSKENGYLFTFNIAKGFKFEYILGNLGNSIDKLFSIDTGCLILNSYAADSVKELDDQINEVLALEQLDKKIVSPFNELPIQGRSAEKRLEKGLHLHAVFNFSQSVFSETFNYLKNKDEELKPVILYAFFPHSPSLPSQFSAHLPAFSLFDSIQFRGFDGSDYLKFSYLSSVKNDKEVDDNKAPVIYSGPSYTLSGQVGVSYFNTYFDIDLEINDQYANAKLELAPNSLGEIKSPFGLPDVFVIKKLTGNFEYIFKPPEQRGLSIALNGRVALFNKEIAAQLYLVNNNLIIFTVNLLEDLSLLDFVKGLWGEGEWSSDIFNLTLKFNEKSGYGTGLYYYEEPSKEAKDRETVQRFVQKNYPGCKEGFNLNADVELKLPFLDSIIIYLSASIINKENSKGIKASIRLLEPINLFGIMELADGSSKAPGQKYKGSPSLILDTTKTPRVYMFEAGLNFFGEAVATTKITWKQQGDENLLEGVIKPSDLIPGLGHLEINFRYDNTGFTFKNWPNFIGKDVIACKKFLEKLNKVANALTCKSICSVLADNLAAFIVDENLFTTSFFLTPDFNRENLDFYLNVTGHYKVMVTDKLALTTINFKNLFKIKLSGIRDISFSGLASYIFSEIAKQPKIFAEALLQNGTELAIVLGFIWGVKKLAKSAIEGICEVLLNAAQKFLLSLIGTAIVDALAAAALAAGAALSAAAAATIALSTILKIISELFGGSKGDDKQVCIPHHLPYMPRWSEPPIQYSRDNQAITFKWEESSYAFGGYEIKIESSDGISYSIPSKYKETQANFFWKDFDKQFKEISAQVRSIGLMGNSKWNEPQLIKNLPAPSAPEWLFSDSPSVFYNPSDLSLVVQWMESLDAVGYHAQLETPGGKFREIKTDPSITEAKFFLKDYMDEPAGEFSVKIQALGLMGESDWNVPQIIVKLSEPADLQLSCLPDGKLGYTFKPVQNADQYWMKFLDKNNEKALEDLPIPASDLISDKVSKCIHLNLSPEIIGEKLRVSLQSISTKNEAIESQWSPEIELNYLDKPSKPILAFNHKDNNISLKFNSVSCATYYKALLFQTIDENTALEKIEIFSDGSSGREITDYFKSFKRDTQGQLFAQVYAFFPEKPHYFPSLSIKSDPINCYLAIPQNLVVSYLVEGNEIKIDFQKVEYASQYEIEISHKTSDKNEFVKYFPVFSISQEEDTVSKIIHLDSLGIEPQAMRGLSLKARAISGNGPESQLESEWSEETVIQYLNAPSEIEQIFNSDNNEVKIKFKPVESATRYSFKLVNVAQSDTVILPEIISQPIVSGKFCFFSFKISELLLPELWFNDFKIQVKAIGDSKCIPSLPVYSENSFTILPNSYIPIGSYKEHCKNIKVVLKAQCQYSFLTTNFVESNIQYYHTDYAHSELDITQLKLTKIDNKNGQLSDSNDPSALDKDEPCPYLPKGSYTNTCDWRIKVILSADCDKNGEWVKSELEIQSLDWHHDIDVVDGQLTVCERARPKNLELIYNEANKQLEFMPALDVNLEAYTFVSQPSKDYFEESFRLKCDRLLPSQVLEEGEYLLSKDETTQLTLQQNGQLKLSRSGITLWKSGNLPDSSVKKGHVTKNGNLVLEDKFGNEKWSTGTGGLDCAYLKVKAGSAYIKEAKKDISQDQPKKYPYLWSTNPRLPNILPATHRLVPGQKLKLGESIFSKDGSTCLKMQKDGNLVLLENDVQIWKAESSQGENSVKYCIMGIDGDLALMTGSNSKKWSISQDSGQEEQPGTYLEIEKGALLLKKGDEIIFQKDSSSVIQSSQLVA